MIESRNAPPADAFFLKAEEGERFCLYHPPAPTAKAKASFIYVHPFCEEMNCSRRMASRQARALAELGYGVLQIDLFGCGDSSGDFGDARWHIWKNDLALAEQWIEDRFATPIALWGLRLGATLAMDYLNDGNQAIARVVLWHPVLNGETYLAQFWRLKLAGQMLSGEEKRSPAPSLRDALSIGESVDVAGYSLAPEMANAIARLRLGSLATKDTRVDWFDLVPKGCTTVAPAIARTVESWKERQADLHLHLVAGPAFWSAPELGISQALLDGTTQLLAGAAN